MSDDDVLSTRPWFLVSGGSGGIGGAVCEALSARGFLPVVGYHCNASAAQTVAQRCGGRGLALDLSDPASILAGIAALEAAPRLAGVVLAGSPPPTLGPFGQIAEDEMERQWRVNVLGPQQLLAGLVRSCFRKHKRGSVVGILSRAMGVDGGPAASGMGAYVIAKYGMAGVLALLAADYPWLRVRTVKPGYTETRMLAGFDERFLALQRDKLPFSKPEEIASSVVQEAFEA